MSADEIQILHALPDLSQALSHSDASMFIRFAVHSDYHGDRAVTTTPSRPDDASPSCPHIFQELREIPMTNDLINDIWMDTDMKCVVGAFGIWEPPSIDYQVNVSFLLAMQCCQQLFLGYLCVASATSVIAQGDQLAVAVPQTESNQAQRTTAIRIGRRCWRRW